jgi:hypothetical protein
VRKDGCFGSRNEDVVSNAPSPRRPLIRLMVCIFYYQSILLLRPAGIISPDDTISLLEPLHALSYFVNKSAYIAAKNSGPLLHEDTVVLHVVVERIDSHSGVLHNDLAWTRGGHGRFADLKGGRGRREVGCEVLGRRHRWDKRCMSDGIERCWCGCMC